MNVQFCILSFNSIHSIFTIAIPIPSYLALLPRSDNGPEWESSLMFLQYLVLLNQHFLNFLFFLEILRQHAFFMFLLILLSLFPSSVSHYVNASMPWVSLAVFSHLNHPWVTQHSVVSSTISRLTPKMYLKLLVTQELQPTPKSTSFPSRIQSHILLTWDQKPHCPTPASSYFKLLFQLALTPSRFILKAICKSFHAISNA